MSATKENRYMVRRLVRPSNAHSVGYDAPSETLELEFRGVGVCQCSGVPETIYQGFMRAASKGSISATTSRDGIPTGR